MTMKDSAIEKLPKPTGWRVLVLPYKRKEIVMKAIKKIIDVNKNDNDKISKTE